MNIPQSDIYLVKLDIAATLNEHVNTICLPTGEFVPVGTNCFIHGTHEVDDPAGNAHIVYNHAIKTRIVGKCNIVASRADSFEICTRQTVPTGECLKNWSGALVCPDNNGRYFGVGIFYAGNSQCSPGSPSNIPDEFVNIVGNTARSAITNLINTKSSGAHAYVDLQDLACNPLDGKLRCPLGKCLEAEQVCDGTPQCEDAADEDPVKCKKKFRMCEMIDSEHCEVRIIIFNVHLQF